MSNLTLTLDKKAEETVEKLKEHYGATSKAEIFRKGITLLNIARQVEDTHGELIARKGDKETRIVVR